jgi:response regulator of citrate/malate metabolism
LTVEDTLKTIDKILKGVIGNSVSTHRLSRRTGVSLVTVRKWIRIIDYITNHPIQIEVIEHNGGSRKFLYVKEAENASLQLEKIREQLKVPQVT